MEISNWAHEAIESNALPFLFLGATIDVKDTTLMKSTTDAWKLSQVRNF